MASKHSIERRKRSTLFASICIVCRYPVTGTSHHEGWSDRTSRAAVCYDGLCNRCRVHLFTQSCRQIAASGSHDNFACAFLSSVQRCASTISSRRKTLPIQPWFCRHSLALEPASGAAWRRKWAEENESGGRGTGRWSAQDAPGLPTFVPFKQLLLFGSRTPACPLPGKATRVSHGPDEIHEYAFVVVLQIDQVVGEAGEVVADASLQVLSDMTIDRGQRAAAVLI
jgi:hypothetical protein